MTWKLHKKDKLYNVFHVMQELFNAVMARLAMQELSLDEDQITVVYLLDQKCKEKEVIQLNKLEFSNPEINERTMQLLSNKKNK